jgi:hypothetical protein
VDQYALGVICLFVLAFAATWRWAGTAIAPAADIDGETALPPGDALVRNGAGKPPSNTSDGSIPDLAGAKRLGSFRFGANYYSAGPPLFNTVTVRAFALEAAAVVIGVALIGDPGAIIRVGGDLAERFPLLSTALATVCLPVALTVGLHRQSYSLMLSRTATFPVVDDKGRARFVYLGDVPPEAWCHSPWYRAVTWGIVAITSSAAAIIIAARLGPLIGVDVPLATIALLSLRWIAMRVLLRFIVPVRHRARSKRDVGANGHRLDQDRRR